MRWEISGCDRETGEDIQLSFEASTRDEAESKATKRGILVAECKASVPAVAEQHRTSTAVGAPSHSQMVRARPLKEGMAAGRGNAVAHPPRSNRFIFQTNAAETKTRIVAVLQAIGGTVDDQWTTDTQIEAKVKHVSVGDRIRLRITLVPTPDGSTTAEVFVNAMPFNMGGRKIARLFTETLSRPSVMTFKPRFYLSKRHFIIGGIGAALASVVLVVSLITQSSSTGGQTHSTVIFADFAATFDVNARTTQLQKDEEFSHLKGCVVEWEGFVEQVDDHSVSIQEKATTTSSDVELDVADSDRASLSTLNVGNEIKYSGTLDSYGGMLLRHKLVDGHIISVIHTNADERLQWLAKNETAIMEKITR